MDEHNLQVGVEVLTAVSTKMAIFWAYRQRSTRLHGATTQKTAIYINYKCLKRKFTGKYLNLTMLK
jgi:hypothetical protein